MQYVIIDESGRFADPTSRIMVVSAIATNSLIGLDKIIPLVKKRVPTKGSRKRERSLAEIKFSTTGDKTKKLVFQTIARQNVEIFLLIVDTEGRKIIDNPENYSLLVSKLLVRVKRGNPQLSHIIIDRHFTWIYQREIFNQLVQERVNKKLFIEHLDSQQNTIVSIADFVAGAIREFYANDNPIWKKIIKDKIVYEKRIFWRELKKQKR